MPDGSLFVPVALLDKHAPFDRLAASREGSYWNLVMPYALSSGVFAPHSAEADGLFRYLLGHGSRLLGVVRAKAESLYGNRRYPVSGIDQVYGLNVSRFLADNGKSDQLVLSLYGTLTAGMTPDTYVSGESSSVAPLRGSSYRSMYLPPNLGANATFLETLRLMLVHETRGPTERHAVSSSHSRPRARGCRTGRRSSSGTLPQLRPGLVLDRAARSARPRHGRRASVAGRAVASPPPATARRGQDRVGSSLRARAPLRCEDRDDRPLWLGRRAGSGRHAPPWRLAALSG